MSGVSAPPAVPVLRLLRAERGRRHGLPRVIDSALLGFDYGGHRVRSGEPGDRIERRIDGDWLRIDRQPAVERAAAELLDRLGLFTDEAESPELRWPRQTRDWLALQAGAFPVLERRGWRIETDADFGTRLRQAATRWKARWQAQGERQALDVTLDVGGRRRPLLPLLQAFLADAEDPWSPARFAALPDDAPIILRDPDGGDWVSLPAAELKPLLAALVELFDSHSPLDREGHLVLPAAAPLVLDLGRASGVDGAALRPPWPEVLPPAALQAELRGYQREGLAWLQALRRTGTGGILADDMGLGKTLQALAHLVTEQAEGRLDCPALVIAPTSLMFNWQAEARRFAPSLRLLGYHGPRREPRFGDADLVLTTYPLLLRDFERLQAQPWHVLILDEAQTIKNRSSQAAQRVRQLPARHRLCLSGTPMENHLGEFWSLMHFLQPGLFGDEAAFNRRFRHPIERQGDRVAEAALRARAAPFLLRRTKALVAPELPPRTEILRAVPLEADQRQLYEVVRLAMDAQVRRALAEETGGRGRMVVLDALLKLRQVCCDPGLVKLDAARSVQGSAKLDLLMELLEKLLEQGRRILVFSQFTEMLSRIETRLEEAGLPWLKLTGETRDRGEVVARFQRGEVPLFLVSLKAGGVGLNLTAADTVIHYDPWWNPAVERQATDRAHRIGQTQPVFVYKLVTEGTVEQKILDLQARKQDLADALLGEGGTPVLSPELLSDLLAPLEAPAVDPVSADPEGQIGLFP